MGIRTDVSIDERVREPSGLIVLVAQQPCVRTVECWNCQHELGEKPCSEYGKEAVFCSTACKEEYEAESERLQQEYEQ